MFNIHFKNPISSPTPTPMQKINKYYLEQTKKQHNIMTNNLKKINIYYNDNSNNCTNRSIKKGI